MARKGEGKIALVTGTSSGIGDATARALLAEGFEVFATATDSASLSELRAAGCETIDLDVTDEASMKAAVEQAEVRTGSVDVLVNNAGYGQYGPIEEIPIDDIRKQFEVNVFGLIRMCQLVLPGMRRAKSGRIINISSVAGEINQPGAGIYHASKHAVEAVDGAMRIEVEPFGVQIIGILPGPVNTKFDDVAVAQIPDTGLASPYLIFKQNLEKVTRDMLNPKVSSGVLEPEDVAAKVIEAATAESPSARYHVGLKSKVFSAVSGLLPDSLYDAGASRMVPSDKVLE